MTAILATHPNMKGTIGDLPFPRSLPRTKGWHLAWLGTWAAPGLAGHLGTWAGWPGHLAPALGGTWGRLARATRRLAAGLELIATTLRSSRERSTTGPRVDSGMNTNRYRSEREHVFADYVKYTLPRVTLAGSSRTGNGLED